MESRHAAAMYSLIEKNPDCDILQSMPDEKTWWTVRKRCVQMILHTDMTKHFEMVSKCELMCDMKGCVKEMRKGADPGSFSSDDDKQFLLNLILHASDISNPCKPLDVYKDWV